MVTDIEEQVMSIIRNETVVPVSKATVLGELGLDSLEMIDLFHNVEKQTGIILPFDELPNLITVGDLLCLVAKPALR